jgi:hypothetical protein
MAFNHQQYNTLYVLNVKNGGEPINDAAEKYGVRITPANVAEGQTYWRVIGIHHLFPRENFSNHHVYLEALDEAGNRIKNPFAWAGWTWVGRRPNERADPVVLDKPNTESAGNIAMHFQQTVSVWMKGLNRDGNDVTDTVENLHTRHPDEPLPDGSLLNTLGHHSFYVVFQRTRKISAMADGIISGHVERGAGHTIQLKRSNQVVGQKTLDQTQTFRFENLAYGVYSIEILNANVRQDNIIVDANNKEINLKLAVPPPTKSSIFGTVKKGIGRTLLLIKEGNIIARIVIPESTEFRFINLAAGTYSIQVFDTAVREDNIALDGTNSREIHLVVPGDSGQPTEKIINHYLLFGPPGTRGRQSNLLLATNFILKFSITAGYSVEEAKKARRVSIIGEGISPAQQQAIRDAGSELEVLAGALYDIEAELQARIESGNAFPTRPDTG